MEAIRAFGENVGEDVTFSVFWCLIRKLVGWQRPCVGDVFGFKIS